MEGFTKYDSPEDIPIVLKQGDRVFFMMVGTALIEPRRDRGHSEGGSRGVSLRIAKGMSYRVGGHRGTYVRGEERQTLIDEGMAVITNQRVVFQGA